jgi:hypothetical protein
MSESLKLSLYKALVKITDFDDNNNHAGIQHHKVCFSQLYKDTTFQNNDQKADRKYIYFYNIIDEEKT